MFHGFSLIPCPGIMFSAISSPFHICDYLEKEVFFESRKRHTGPIISVVTFTPLYLNDSSFYPTSDMNWKVILQLSYSGCSLGTCLTKKEPDQYIYLYMFPEPLFLPLWIPQLSTWCPSCISIPRETQMDLCRARPSHIWIHRQCEPTSPPLKETRAFSSLTEQRWLKAEHVPVLMLSSFSSFLLMASASIRWTLLWCLANLWTGLLLHLFCPCFHFLSHRNCN